MTDAVHPVEDRDKICFDNHPEDGEGRVCVRPKGHEPLTGPTAMSVGALREAIVTATELGGAYGQNLHESKDVVIRVDDELYPLTEVSVGFNAGTGQFVMYLTGGTR